MLNNYRREIRSTFMERDINFFVYKDEETYKKSIWVAQNLLTLVIKNNIRKL